MYQNDENVRSSYHQIRMPDLAGVSNISLNLKNLVGIKFLVLEVPMFWSEVLVVCWKMTNLGFWVQAINLGVFELTGNSELECFLPNGQKVGSVFKSHPNLSFEGLLLHSHCFELVLVCKVKILFCVLFPLPISRSRWYSDLCMFDLFFFSNDVLPHIEIIT